MTSAIENDRGNPNVLVATAHSKYSLIIYSSDLNETKVLVLHTNTVYCFRNAEFKYDLKSCSIWITRPHKDIIPYPKFFQFSTSTTTITGIVGLQFVISVYFEDDLYSYCMHWNIHILERK